MIRRASVWVVLALVCGACTAPKGEADPRPDAGPAGMDAGWTDEAGRRLPTPWPADLATDRVVIPVCWDNPDAASDIEREWVRDAAERAWQRLVDVDFVGWGACAADARGVHLRIGAPFTLDTAGLGAELDGVVGGVTLDLGLTSPELSSCRTSRERRVNCVQRLAIHLFGHVVGLPDIEARSDIAALQPRCTSEPPHAVADWGGYVSGSVMSECDWPSEPATEPVEAEGLRPLASDLLRAQVLYRPRGGGYLVDPRGRCLLEGEDGLAVGSCAHAGAVWSTSGGAISRAGRCLSTDAEGRVVLGDCEGAPVSGMPRARLRGWAGLCLHAPASEGGNTWMGSCDDAELLDYDLAAETFRSVSLPERCLTVVETIDAASARVDFVQLQPCDGSLRQRFWADGSFVRWRGGPLLLDVRSITLADYMGGMGWPGVARYDVQVHPLLGGQPNQRWSWLGAVRIGERCLAIEIDDAGVERPVARGCGSSSTEEWDLYPSP